MREKALLSAAVIPRVTVSLLACVLLSCAIRGGGPAGVAPSAPMPARLEAVAPNTEEKADATGDGVASRRFKILQVNDVYKIEGLEGGTVGGLGRIRTLRKQLEAEGPVLLLHGGDALFPSVMSKFLDARPMVECLNLLDGDPEAFDQRLLLTFGNHEFDPRSPDVIAARLRESGFRWVTSNIYFRPVAGARPVPFGSHFPNVHHSLVLDIAGLKVAVFSITVDDAERDYLHYDYAYGENANVRNAVIRTTLAALMEQAPDVIIALTHQAMNEDILLAEDFPEIDLIVGGHDHLTQHARIGETLITKADADAKTAYVIDVDATNPFLVKSEAKLVNLGIAVEPDRQIQRTVGKWLATLADMVPGFDQSFGSTEHLLGGEEPLLRGGETAMGNWLSDVVRETLVTDIGLVQGGGVRINDNVPAQSDIKGEHLEGIFYFDGDVVSFSLTGQELLEILRNSVSKVHAGDGRFLQVSGLRFEYGVVPGAVRDPSYIVEPENVEVQRKGDAGFLPLDLTASYTVATLKHLWEQGKRYGYPIFSAGAGGSSPELIEGADGEYGWRAITEAWLVANQRVTVDIEGRIRSVEVGATDLE